MKLLEFRTKTAEVAELHFKKPDGSSVPRHFHITELGQIDKRYIDCGGTLRVEHAASMQLWESIDVWHRLTPEKLLKILDLGVEKLEIGDHDVEVEYQENGSIGKFGVEFKDGYFWLANKQTACLASDACGIPVIAEIKAKASACCTPGGGCC